MTLIREKDGRQEGGIPVIQVRLQPFTVYESALMRTTSTLIETNESLIVIDPTWLPEEIATIRRDVELRRRGKKLYVIYTHQHYDHIIGAYAFPDATVIASQAFVETDASSQLDEIQSFYEQYYIDRPIIKPAVDIMDAWSRVDPHVFNRRAVTSARVWRLCLQYRAPVHRTRCRGVFDVVAETSSCHLRV